MEIQREAIIEKLREQGCRITKQRLAIIDTILEHECSSCKELCCLVAKQNVKVGQATVYRMVNTLEEIGAINRNSALKVNL